MTDIRIDQAVAVEDTPQSIGSVYFGQIIKGWSGAGFTTSSRSVEGTFIHASNVAQIMFKIIDTKNGRNYMHSGSIVLKEEDAIKFALAIAPKEVRQKVEAYDDLVKLLNDIKTTIDCGGEYDINSLYYEDIAVALNKHQIGAQ